MSKEAYVAISVETPDGVGNAHGALLISDWENTKARDRFLHHLGKLVYKDSKKQGGKNRWEVTESE